MTSSLANKDDVGPEGKSQDPLRVIDHGQGITNSVSELVGLSVDVLRVVDGSGVACKCDCNSVRSHTMKLCDIGQK